MSADFITGALGRSDQPVNLGKVADVKPIYQGQVHLGVPDVKVPLQVAYIPL